MNIFVFGSNEAGKHGAGAARYARLYYGAVYGQGEGLWGNSYAIPTKNRYIKTLSLVEVATYINNFIYFAKSNPELTFDVSRIGCGLAGFKNRQIAPLFIGSPINCRFDNKWKEWLPYNETWCDK
jgi:hypothetical protein